MATVGGPGPRPNAGSSGLPVGKADSDKLPVPSKALIAARDITHTENTRSKRSLGIQVVLGIVSGLLGAGVVMKRAICSLCSKSYKMFRNARDEGKAKFHVLRFKSMIKGASPGEAVQKILNGPKGNSRNVASLAAKKHLTGMIPCTPKGDNKVKTQKMTRGLLKMLSDQVGVDKAAAFSKSEDCKDVMGFLMGTLNGMDTLEETYLLEPLENLIDVVKDPVIRDALENLIGTTKEDSPIVQMYLLKSAEVISDVSIRDKKIPGFLKALKEIQTIANSDTSNMSARECKNQKQKLLKAMYVVFSHPIYEQIKEDEDNKITAYLHDMAEKFYFDADGIDAMDDFMKASEEAAVIDGSTKVASGVSPEDMNLGQSGAHLTGLLKSSTKHSIDKHTKLGKLAYVTICPDRVAHSHAAKNKDASGLRYDPLQAGNDTATSGSMTVGDREAVHAYTPSLTIGSKLNPIAAAAFQRIENRRLSGGEGMTAIQICTMQDMNSEKAEGERTLMTLRLAEKYPFAVQVSGWDMDHPMIAGKEPWAEFETVASYAKKWKVSCLKGIRPLFKHSK